jgi:hypothetical protein
MLNDRTLTATKSTEESKMQPGSGANCRLVAGVAASVIASGVLAPTAGANIVIGQSIGSDTVSYSGTVTVEPAR